VFSGRFHFRFLSANYLKSTASNWRLADVWLKSLLEHRLSSGSPSVFLVTPQRGHDR